LLSFDGSSSPPSSSFDGAAVAPEPPATVVFFRDLRRRVGFSGAEVTTGFPANLAGPTLTDGLGSLAAEVAGVTDLTFDANHAKRIKYFS